MADFPYYLYWLPSWIFLFFLSFSLSFSLFLSSFIYCPKRTEWLTNSTFQQSFFFLPFLLSINLFNLKYEKENFYFLFLPPFECSLRRMKKEWHTHTSTVLNCKGNFFPLLQKTFCGESRGVWRERKRRNRK